jgi:predicted solute-binding protein
VSKTPIDFMLDAVKWTATDQTPDSSDLPFATHAGVLTIGDKALRCYRLNTGEAVFDADDVVAFFDGALT